MPESWIDEMVGDEALPRRGFEDDLAKQLKHEWRRGGSPAWRPLIWAAAAVAAVVGISLAVANRDNDRVAPADSTPASVVTQTTVPAPTTTAEPAPTSSTVEETTTTAAPTTTMAPPTDEAGVIVYGYLTALAQERWDDAAKLLNEGGLELEARSDLRPLFDERFGLVPYDIGPGDIAGALRLWCDQALCDMPVSLVTVDDRQIATWEISPGLQRSTTFAGYTFEGYPGVLGLPLQSPADAVSRVDCPTDQVISQSYADLDGDGWFEMLVVQPFTTSGGDHRLLTVCGSDLVVTPLELEANEGAAIYAVNPTGQGGDTLLVSAGMDVTGRVLALEGENLLQPMSSDGPATFLFTVQPEGAVGESAGCGSITPGSTPTLVGDSYRYIGGSDLSNSTGLEYIRRNLVGRTLTEHTTRLNLPAQEEEAFRVIAGFCNGLPVITD